MKKITFLILSLLVILNSCEEDEVINQNFLNIKIKKIAPVLEGIDTENMQNLGINFFYNSNGNISGINEWVLDYDNGILATLSKHDIDTVSIGFGDNPEETIIEHYEKYSYQWNNYVCQRTLDTLYRRVGKSISIVKGLTRYYFYNTHNMIDSIVINDQLNIYPNTYDSYGYSYRNEDITEIRSYKRTFQGFVLVERLKYQYYRNTINPYYVIYQNTRTQLPIFSENLISKHLPKVGEVTLYKSDGTELIKLNTEYKYILNSKGLPIFIEHETNKTIIEYY